MRICSLGARRCFFRLQEENYAEKPSATRREALRGKKLPLLAEILNLISVLCCHLGNHAFPKPIRVIVSLEEPISELGQILSKFDDMEMISWLPRPEAFLSPSILVFQEYLFFQHACHCWF